MANRVLRDWTTSDKVDQLSLQAEVFFTRLIMKADDHGCFHANVKLLKAALFPLKDISFSKIEDWRNECAEVGIIQLYKIENREFLKILDFNQRLRNMVSKFPQPADGTLTIVGNKPPETKRNEVETEEEKNPNAPLRAFVLPFDSELFKNTWADWEQHRKEKKNKLTPKAISQQIKFLGGRPENDAIEIINQSIKNGWTGLFELKFQSPINEQPQQRHETQAERMARIR